MVPHWLAIEGVQPNIPENAPVERQKLKRPRAEVAHHKVARKKQETGTLALDCVRTVACSSAAAVLYGNINPGCTGPRSASSVQQDGAGEQQAAAVIPQSDSCCQRSCNFISKESRGFSPTPKPCRMMHLAARLLHGKPPPILVDLTAHIICCAYT